MKKDCSRWIRLDMNWDSTEWLFNLPTAAQLAWIKLLCYVKQNGIKGKVRTPSLAVLSAQWKIDAADIETMLFAAKANGSVGIDGSTWTLTTWEGYQNPESKKRQDRRTRAAERENVSADKPGLLSRDNDRDTDTDNDREIDRESTFAPTLNSRQRKPTLSEVIAHGLDIQLRTKECEGFFHYYNARGWLLSKGVHMVNWHSALYLWRNRTNEFASKYANPESSIISNIPCLPDDVLERLTA